MKKRIRNTVIAALSFAMLFATALVSSNAACSGWTTYSTGFQCIIGQRCVLSSPANMYTYNTIYYQERYCDGANGQVRETRVTSAATSCCWG